MEQPPLPLPPPLAPPPPGQFHSPHPGLPAAPTDGEAIASLVLGILGVFPFCSLGIVLGPLAFFLGHSALRRIRASGGAVGGEGMAQAGRALGVASTVVWVLGAIVFLAVITFGMVARTTGGSGP